jgi:hypothetical protein
MSGLGPLAADAHRAGRLPLNPPRLTFMSTRALVAADSDIARRMNRDAILARAAGDRGLTALRPAQ